MHAAAAFTTAAGFTAAAADNDGDGDDYEVDDYNRVRATLKSGRCCWIYAAAN